MLSGVYMTIGKNEVLSIKMLSTKVMEPFPIILQVTKCWVYNGSLLDKFWYPRTLR